MRWEGRPVIAAAGVGRKGGRIPPLQQAIALGGEPPSPYEFLGPIWALAEPWAQGRALGHSLSTANFKTKTYMNILKCVCSYISLTVSNFAYIYIYGITRKKKDRAHENRIETLLKKTCCTAPIFFVELISLARTGVIKPWPKYQSKSTLF